MKFKIVAVIIVILQIFQLLAGTPLAYSSSAISIEALSKPGGYIPDKKDQQAIQDEVNIAILSSIAQSEYGWGAENFQWRLDNLTISPDGNWAKAWIVAFDPEQNWVVSTEPGLALARLVEGEWQVFLPDDPEWVAKSQIAPLGLFASSEQGIWRDQTVANLQEIPKESLTGYHLPWIQGNTVYLSRSVSHDEDIPSGKAHYAFDFYIHDTMWPIYAAKSGYVYSFCDDVPNDDHTQVNFLVLQNADDPDLYQLYLHLAQDSISPGLKVVGAQVVQGQYIATVDNTGASTGDHLHFHVELKPNWPDDNPYWNQSVDITFDEVDIYGGRPRREWEYDPEFCGGLCVYGRVGYVSDNEPAGDLTPPYGDLSGVSTGDIIMNSTLEISGWGADNDSGFDYGQLVANYGGSWHELGLPFNDSFEYTWDFCNENAVVPDGPVSVALKLYDLAGNWEPLAGLQHFTKNYDCPQPPTSCIPGTDQITLFEDIDFLGGCQRFGVGEYPDGFSLGVIGGNDADSILVGSQVAATVYSDNNFAGHSEAIGVNDSYLVDNQIGKNNLSSMIVSSINATPLTPTLVAPQAGQIFEEGEIIPLSWRNGQGALQYQVVISPTLARNQTIFNTGWQTETFALIEPLPLGTYSWKVIAQNTQGLSPWSEPLTFTVDVASTLPEQVSAPYTDNFETNHDQWTGDGQWTLLDDSGIDGSYAWWYQGADGDYSDGSANFGTLTSPPIQIGSAGYSLWFRYRYETESQNPWWDQRWVQVSVDGGAFVNLYQLSEDPTIPELQSSSWLYSQILDLSPYSGHVICVRFFFTTLDEALNSYTGWGIDDFNIATQTLPVCNDLRQDDTPEQATPMIYDPEISIEGEICPRGDWDYYTFSGSQGDRIVVDVDANEVGSPLDPYLILYDSNGRSVLAEDDDEVLGERRDPLLGYTLPHDGVFYLKIRAWNHPSVGDSNYDYQIRLFTDNDEPNVAINFPNSGQYISGDTITIEAQAYDESDRINRLEFYWHSSNWLNAPWTSLGTDWDGTDGWSIAFDLAEQLEAIGSAVNVIAYDRAGNQSGADSWNLGIDKTAPITNLKDLEYYQESNAFPLQWVGSDNLSGIEYYELQQKMDEDMWQDELSPIQGCQTQEWFVVEPGHAFGYRIHGLDYAGNVEQYPSIAEITVTVPAADVLCHTLDSYDAYGDDNNPASAIPLSTDASQVHNFCNPIESDFQDDEDWLVIEQNLGEHYSIDIFPQSGQSAVILRLYDGDGDTLLGEQTPDQFGRSTRLEWIADDDEQVYLQMVHLDGRVIGTSVSYQVMLREGYYIFLPFHKR